jgi:hypothetical protein
MTRRTWPGGVAAVFAVLSLAGLSACGSSSSGPPKNLSLSGAKLPVTTLTTGLQGLCTVEKDVSTSAAPHVIKNDYFGGAYNALHQLAGVLSGSSSTDLLNAMTAFEKSLLASPPTADMGTNAQALQTKVLADLQTLKVTPPSCLKS